MAVAGVILAGGLARRMGGGDKTLLSLGGKTVLDRIVATMTPQVSALALNANGDAARFAATGLPVLADSVPGYLGPLAGILAGLDWAAGLRVAGLGAAGVRVEWLVSIPGDAPFVPADLVLRLLAGRGCYRYACAVSAGRTHPTAALWPIDARTALRQALMDGQRKIDRFTGPDTAAVEWATDPIDPFLNLNTPEDLAAAARLI